MTTIEQANVQVMGPFEVHTMPTGVSVAYRDKDHSYWKTCEIAGGVWKGTGRLTGVSTVVSPFDFRPDNLMRWAARTNGAGVAALAAEALSLEHADDIRASLRWLESADSIWSALEDARLLFSDASDAAADRGTNVHKHSLQALAAGRPVPDWASMTEIERGYSRGVETFWMDHDLEPLHSETVVVDPRLGVAGRLDLIARSRKLGGVVLLDAKTSGFIPNKHHVQLAGYAHCANECGLIDEFAGAYVLQVGADGSYELIPSQATAESFVMAVKVYREAARIQRDASRAAKKASAA
jgi:hypothetical protein